MGLNVPPIIPRRIARTPTSPLSQIPFLTGSCGPNRAAIVQEGDIRTFFYGVRGIRTLEWLLTITRFPVVLLRPTRTSLHAGRLLYHERGSEVNKPKVNKRVSPAVTTNHGRSYLRDSRTTEQYSETEAGNDRCAYRHRFCTCAAYCRAREQLKPRSRSRFNFRFVFRVGA